LSREVNCFLQKPDIPLDAAWYRRTRFSRSRLSRKANCFLQKPDIPLDSAWYRSARLSRKANCFLQKPDIARRRWPLQCGIEGYSSYSCSYWHAVTV
jgi:hypothetical protein